MTSRNSPFCCTSTALVAALVMVGLSLGSPARADPRASIQGDLDPDLRALLVRAIGEVDGPPTNGFEARRRAEGARDSAEALLRSEGFYQPVIESDVEGEDSPVAVVRITPGPRFVLTGPQIRWVAPEPGAEVVRTAQADIALTAGDPGRAADVIAAEGRVIASLTRQGYPDASTQPRRVVVDHATQTVAPTYNISAGPLVRLDGVRLETRGPTNPAWVAGLAPWQEGDRYDPEQVAELERRLLDTGVYDGVSVALTPADQTTANGTRPIIVTVTDRPRRILEAGATFSTADGSGVDAIWTWYNRFGRADTLRFEARLADIDSRVGADLSLPHWRQPGQTLALSAAAVNEDTDAYRRTAAVLSADLRRRIGKTSFYSFGAGLDAGRYDENRFDPVTQVPISSSRDLAILTGRASAYLDQSNDPLNPTTGWRVTLNVQPTAVAGEDTILFVRAESQLTAYLPLQDAGKTVAAGRVRLGTIVGGGELSVPADRLFYSGGGGSIRGYSYQGVGPRLPDNTPRGGLSLFEASAEVRRDLGRNFGAVAFVDAGAIGFDEAPDFSNLRYAVGIGARYNLSFGPIRADIAFPLDKREGDADFQVYVSIGQAF
ncbi:MAG: autotransporter assembly complex family protein [Brevundimonas sp.]|uniref:autotransporter assembly complex protein TamA n=1 Tax=Brevundimonas sp. TaxID=1871086 RepID=UPI002736314B|nr:autotransporter assembly complex family protein [Brevundimonas sp.]MDP3406344.1 autotransporter assembly complex family protein [Brevundimonas sp.]